MPHLAHVYAQIAQSYVTVVTDTTFMMIVLFVVIQAI